MNPERSMLKRVPGEIPNGVPGEILGKMIE